MFCTNCGTNIPAGSAFCPGCGCPIGAPAPQQPPQQQVPWQQAPQATQPAKASAVESAKATAARAVDKINAMAGGTDHVELKFGYFFDSVFKKHARTEADELFACGGPTTTPSVENISKEWPHPWLYSRVLAVLLLTLGGLYVLSSSFGNPNGYPGVIFIGALAVPFATVAFFFETNAPRNISFAYVLEIFFLGGVFSILCVYPLSAIIPGAGLGEVIPSLLTGVVEELAKVALVAFFMNRTRGRNYILSGLLIGAAVGAGFAVFETAGYIFNAYSENLANIVYEVCKKGVAENMALTTLYSYGFEKMLGTAWMRALLAIGGHVAWAAVEGGALALCDDGTGFKPEHLWSAKFLPFLATTIVLHGIWDMIPSELTGIEALGQLGKWALLIAIIWIVLFVLLHRGVAQVNELSEQASAGAGPASR